MSRRTLNAPKGKGPYDELEKLVGRFNEMTGRPLRAYEPSDEPYPPANIGFAYARCLGEQDGNRLVVSVIMNYGGGVNDIYGLSGYANDVEEKLKKKLADPEWVKANQFDGSQWRPNPPIAHMPGDILRKVSARGADFQVFVTGDDASLRINADRELASHPNPHSCHRLMQRMLQESEARVMDQVDYIEACGGRVDRALVTGVINRLHAPPSESVTGSFLESLSQVNQPCKSTP